MKYKNKKVLRNTNYELIKMSIPKSIRDKIKTYNPTDDLKEVRSIEFLKDLTILEKTKLIALFPELEEVII